MLLLCLNWEFFSPALLGQMDLLFFRVLKTYYTFAKITHNIHFVKDFFQNQTLWEGAVSGEHKVHATVLTFSDAAQSVIIINFTRNDFLIKQPYKHFKICITVPCCLPVKLCLEASLSPIWQTIHKKQVFNTFEWSRQLDATPFD